LIYRVAESQGRAVGRHVSGIHQHRRQAKHIHYGGKNGANQHAMLAAHFERVFFDRLRVVRHQILKLEPVRWNGSIAEEEVISFLGYIKHCDRL